MIRKPIIGNVTIVLNCKKIEMYLIRRLMEHKKRQFGVGVGLPTLTCIIHDYRIL